MLLLADLKEAYSSDSFCGLSYKPSTYKVLLSSSPSLLNLSFFDSFSSYFPLD